MRAAKIDQDSLRLYTARLIRENTGDVIAALQKLAEMPRENFETALPGIAEILALVTTERISRENRSTAKQTERLVRWQCPACKHTCCGFPSRGSDLDRRCDKNVWNEEQFCALPCGTLMTVIFDDAHDAEADLEKWEQPAWMGRAGQ